jgi:SAM-dependent methyltransferase
MSSAAQYFWRNKRYLYPPNWHAGAKALYRRLSKSSIFLADDIELGLCSLDPVKKIACLIELAKPRSVLDIGCGTGEAVKDFRSHGIEALGVEGSLSAIQRSSCREFIRQHDLRRPLHLDRRFDLVWCFEVAEHIHQLYVDIFVDSLVSHGPIVALSAAPPGQGGEGHFNEQPQGYWIGKFSDRGFILQREWTEALQSIEEFYSPNMMVFVRGS